MKIALASDHAGYDLKEQVAAYLGRRGIEFHDFGCYSLDSVDYAVPGAAAAGAVSSGEYDRCILVCGTGLGMELVANKFKGVRATPCWTEYVAEMSRRHNDSNCLTLGGRTHTVELALACVKAWLDTEFEGGRHARRVDMIRKIEDANFK